MATDVGPEKAAIDGWTETGQHSTGLDEANSYGICEPTLFNERTSFREVDMRSIPSDLRNFDFTWSSCAFEHLGSLEDGLKFVLQQMDCLNPGGVAIHTTEYNVRSNSATVARGQTVLYRRRDIVFLAKQLRRLGHSIAIDYRAGASPADNFVDHPPWSGPHLKIQLGRYVATSMALVITKGAEGSTAIWRPNVTWRCHWIVQRISIATIRALDRLGRGLARLTKVNLRRK